MGAVKKSFIVMVGLLLTNTGLHTFAGDVEPVNPSKKEKCPVCGMFVARYPDWVGEIAYEDRTAVFFDGVKDLFSYYFDIQKYHPQKNRNEIKAIFVTEYYGLEFIDAFSAWYVIGSDVYGPMGRELIPFKSRADAQGFMKDHGGTQIVTFSDVTAALISTLGPH